MNVIERPNSHLLATRAGSAIAGGVNSNVRLSMSSYFFSRGSGSHIWDVDGNEYIDYVLGQGPLVLGHAHPAILEEVARSCAEGMVFGAQSPLEVEAAELILAATKWPERVRLCMTGSEGIQAAIRIARAATGRSKIVCFIGHYHGWIDNVLNQTGASPPKPSSLGQLASSLDQTLVAPWNDLDALVSLLEARGSEIAAVLMEPVMLNTSAVEPNPGYLQGVRQACSAHGVVLIFDEVITGFRVALGGAAQHYGVFPDLAVYGKAIAGGWPVAAVVGRAELMDLLGEGVNHSGTFNGSVMACAATIATLKLLMEEPPYPAISNYGSTLMSGISERAADNGAPLSVEGLPAAFVLRPDTAATAPTLQGDPGRAVALQRVLAQAGLWTTSRGMWFISAAHDQADLEATFERAAKAFVSLRDSATPGRS